MRRKFGTCNTCIFNNNLNMKNEGSSAPQFRRSSPPSRLNLRSKPPNFVRARPRTQRTWLREQAFAGCRARRQASRFASRRRTAPIREGGPLSSAPNKALSFAAETVQLCARRTAELSARRTASALLQACRPSRKANRRALCQTDCLSSAPGVPPFAPGGPLRYATFRAKADRYASGQADRRAPRKADRSATFRARRTAELRARRTAPLRFAPGGPLRFAPGGPQSSAQGGPQSSAQGGPQSSAQGGPLRYVSRKADHSATLGARRIAELCARRTCSAARRRTALLQADLLSSAPADLLSCAAGKHETLRLHRERGPRYFPRALRRFRGR